LFAADELLAAAPIATVQTAIRMRFDMTLLGA
jgi:hypothetical protein